MMPGRRAFMITGAAAADFGVGGGAAWAAETPIRYPEPNIKVLDPRFQPYVLGNAAIERIAGGCRFTEGPVWFGDGHRHLGSALPSDEWALESGATARGFFRDPHTGRPPAEKGVGDSPFAQGCTGASAAAGRSSTPGSQPSTAESRLI